MIVFSKDTNNHSNRKNGKDTFYISSLQKTQKEQALLLFNESSPKSKIKNFNKLLNKSSSKRIAEHKKIFTDVIVATDKRNYILGLYIFEAQQKRDFVVKRLIIPGPIGKTKIFKIFIENIVRLALKYNCTSILYNNPSSSDWQLMFLQEIGFQKLGYNSLKLNLKKT